ncbi:putative UDP-rhamnose:rhamnosyltransferase 1 [Magnolia sinica]|uniref:putative UDP-rhamnose:rhamnosyltransferase 1 n=1 Tax=Magnolia sinica TaxID=86752 RepID=UPI00265AC401|nr:putative UDP-rhamnose:rhamnosyltransferase 1 [Magnolia sinica]
MGDGMHVVMLPWLAFGHMIPFLHLSIALAKSGIRISFLTTQKNIQRLPKIPPHLTALINLVELPFLSIDGLPEGAEATVDILHGTNEYLKKAYNLSYPFFEQFITDESSDWIIHSLQGCSMMAIRTCAEFGGEYLGLLKKLHQIPVIPIRLLPPRLLEKRETTDPKWAKTLKWLDEQPNRSVVFVCFGSECKLSRDQVFEIAYGLQLSNFPFLWALRRPIWATNDMDTLLLGFESWIASRGVVHMGWVPQLEILAHYAIGRSLFHSRWGSIIETVQYGHALIVLPLANVQSLDARHLVDKGLAIQVEINNDGSFHRDAIARSLRWAVVEEEGESIKRKSMEVRPVFSDQKLHQSYLNEFINFLKSSDGKWETTDPK